MMSSTQNCICLLLLTIGIGCSKAPETGPVITGGGNNQPNAQPEISNPVPQAQGGGQTTEIRTGAWIPFSEAQAMYASQQTIKHPWLIFINTHNCGACIAWERDLRELPAGTLNRFILTKLDASKPGDKETAAAVYQDMLQRKWINAREADPPTLIIYEGLDSRIELGLPESDNLERFLNNELLIRSPERYLGKYRRNSGTSLGESGRTRDGLADK